MRDARVAHGEVMIDADSLSLAASVAASSFDMRDQEQDDDDTDDLSSLSPDLAEQGLHVVRARFRSALAARALLARSHSFTRPHARIHTQVVTHLSPNDAQKRLKETHHIDRLSLEHCELILLGDLNALSRYDEDVYTEAMLLGKLRQDPRLCRKFLDAELQGMPALDRMLCEHADISFATMDNLLRNGSLVDLGYEARLRNGRTFEHTVPTAANEDPLHAAEMRLDYFLATPALARPEVFRDVWVIHVRRCSLMISLTHDISHSLGTTCCHLLERRYQHDLGPLSDHGSVADLSGRSGRQR